MIDRRKVVRSLALIASALGVYGQPTQTQEIIASLKRGQTKKREVPCDHPSGSGLLDLGKERVGSKCYVEEMVPGTASIVLNLNELGSIVVERDGQRVAISRDEIWEALK